MMGTFLQRKSGALGSIAICARIVKNQSHQPAREKSGSVVREFAMEVPTAWADFETGGSED